MTSGEFTSFPIDQISVDRDARQRKHLKDIDELAESINARGLIQPIVITRDGALVAGERRLTACKSLGWTSISVQFADQLDTYELSLIEFEENVKRVNLTWEEECDYIRDYHNLRCKNEKTWTKLKTAEALGMHKDTIVHKLDVAKAREEGDELVLNAPAYSTARNIVQRKKERAKEAIEAKITEEVQGAAETLPEVPLINEDFTKWAADYSGPKFNLIHCDFPYGIGTGDKTGQSGAKSQGGYDDSPETYWELVETLESAMDNVVADSAHLLFWFSMDFYHLTRLRLTEMGWTVNAFPLIWFKSDHTGILPDPDRGPRRIYETCFLATRGDRKIVRAVSNTVAHPGKDKSIHTSEKPHGMLHYFMRMLVDDYTEMLDPTCGSGNAVKVADDLGATRVLGIEQNEEFYTRAKEQYNAIHT